MRTSVRYCYRLYPSVLRFVQFPSEKLLCSCTRDRLALVSFPINFANYYWNHSVSNSHRFARVNSPISFSHQTYYHSHSTLRTRQFLKYSDPLQSVRIQEIVSMDSYHRFPDPVILVGFLVIDRLLFCLVSCSPDSFF